MKSIGGAPSGSALSVTWFHHKKGAIRFDIFDLKISFCCLPVLRSGDNDS
jgi:hypothetical protein